MSAHAPPHPGQKIRSDYLDPLGLTVTAGAAALGISRKTLSELVNGRAGISPEMALRLGKAFGPTARHWMELQMNYDLWRAEQRAEELNVERFVPEGGKKTRIPDELRQYFWDQDPTQMSLEQNRTSIVKRLMESGGWDAVQWLRAQFDDDELRSYLVGRSGRGINPTRLRFWALLLHLPRQQVDGWIAAQASNPWSRRMSR